MTRTRQVGGRGANLYFGDERKHPYRVWTFANEGQKHDRWVLLPYLRQLCQDQEEYDEARKAGQDLGMQREDRQGNKKEDGNEKIKNSQGSGSGVAANA